MDQLEGWSRADFDILNTNGVVVGRIQGTDSAGARFWRGPRNFDILDGDGTLLGQVVDVYNWGRDTYEVHSGASLVARVVRRFSWFSRRITVELASGEELLIEGNFSDREFTVVNAATMMHLARGTREHVGFTRALFGQDQYVLSFDSRCAAEDRLALLGAMLALELMRRKDSRSTVNTATNY